MLTTYGLLLDLAGAILILGPEWKPLERTIRWVDPVYTAVNHGLKKVEKPTEETLIQGIRFLPLRWFLNKFVNESTRIENGMTIVFVGGVLRWDASEFEYWITEQKEGPANISFPSDAHYETHSVSARTIRQTYNKIEREWMYRIGIVLLISGFSLQLLDRLVY